MKIRVLPMSKIEFATLEDALHFLLVEMKERGGIFYYRHRKIVYKEDIIVAFQYNNMIIARAIMTGQSDEGKIENGVEYKGHYLFDPYSIIDCPKFITPQDVKKIMPQFKGFNQSTQYLSEECMGLFYPQNSGFSAEPIGFIIKEFN